LVKGYDDLGISADNAGVKALIGMRNMYTANKALFDGIGATTQGMIALSKLGGMTAGAFHDIQESMIALFRRTQSVMEQTGGTHKDALRPFVAYLAEAEYLAKKYGYALDETTQTMVDQARELGLLGDEAETEADIMKEGFNQVNQSLLNMISSLDRFISRLDSAAGGIAGMPSPNIVWPEPPDYSNVNFPTVVPQYPGIPPSLAYPVVPQPGGGGGGGGGEINTDLPPMMAQGGSGDVTINFNDAGSLDRATIEQTYVPIIVDAINSNSYGARTNMQDALGI